MKITNLFLLLLALAGCGRSVGDLSVELVAEDTITGGLAAGTGDEDIVDGWSATFDTYVVVVSDVAIDGGPGPGRRWADAIAIDLARAGEGGIELTRFDGLDAGLWSDLGFRTAVAGASTMRHASVREADLARMVGESCTYLITGAITRDAETVAFDVCVPADTEYRPCESDTGIEGVTIAASTTTSAQLTLHGDHLFFNGFPVGAEGSVVRRAQWMADADADGDGTVTRADLESIGGSELGTLFPSDPGDGLPGFSLAATPIPLDTAWDYVRAQLMTQGHFQGEGECVATPL